MGSYLPSLGGRSWGCHTCLWRASPVALLPSVITVRPLIQVLEELLRWRDLHQMTLEAGLGWGYPGSPRPHSRPLSGPHSVRGSPGGRRGQVLPSACGHGSCSGGGEKGERNRRKKGGKGQGLEVRRRDTSFPAWPVEGKAEEVRAEGEGAAEEEEVWGGGTGGARGPSGPGGPEVRRPRP